MSLASASCCGRRNGCSEAVGHERRPRRIDVPHEDVASERAEHAGRLGSVDAAADNCRRLGARPAERLRRDHGRRRRPERRHGCCVHERDERTRLGIGEEDEPGDGREALRRVSGERRYPFQHRVTVAERGHGAEVPVLRAGDVHLRLHRPVALRVGDECGLHRLVGVVRRDRPLDIGAGEERDRHRSKPTRSEGVPPTMPEPPPTWAGHQLDRRSDHRRAVCAAHRRQVLQSIGAVPRSIGAGFCSPSARVSAVHRHAIVSVHRRAVCSRSERGSAVRVSASVRGFGHAANGAPFATAGRRIPHRSNLPRRTEPRVGLRSERAGSLC